MTDPFVRRSSPSSGSTPGTLKTGASVLNAAQRASRSASAACCKMHANKREEIERGRGRRHRGGGRPQERHHRRHASAIRQQPDRARVASTSRSRSSRMVDRAQDQGRPGEAGRRPSPSWRRKTRPSRVRHRPRDRPDHHLRHGRAAPGDHRGPAACASSTSRPTSASPQVAYRETIRKAAKVERQARQADRRPRPVRRRASTSRSSRPRAAGSSSSNKIKGGSIPKEYIQPIEAGIREALQRGVLAGYPLVDVKVDADRRQLSRRRLVGDGVQGRRLDGVPGRGRRARRPVLLEPIMRVEVVTPEDFMGTVTGDLNSRRGRR